MRDGDLNPNPEISVDRETPVSILLDGDGGLGYFPAYEGTHRAIAKAKETGIATMATRNHGHFGAAGIYAREAVEAGLLAFVTSGHQLDLTPGDEVSNAAGGSPMAFCAPTDEADPLVLDFGTMHNLYSDSQHKDAIAKLTPKIVLRHIGMGTICQSWGGLLTGLTMDPPPNNDEYTGVMQGALALFFRPDLFIDSEQFKHEMDKYARQVSNLEPLEGFDEAMLPGGPEAQTVRENREHGVPIGPNHRRVLDNLADDIGIATPWDG